MVDDGARADNDRPGASPAIDHTLLRLFHVSTMPDLRAIEVKRTGNCRLLGSTATVRVIGSSHWLSLPKLDFHELCSCRPLPDVGVAIAGTGDDAHPDGGVLGEAGNSPPMATVPAARVRHIPLRPGVERAVTSIVGEVQAETVVEGLSLQAFPAERPFDIGYRFGVDAVTAIVIDGDRFETYHTYPEFDLALHSITELTRVEELPRRGG